MWENSQWFRKNYVQITSKRELQESMERYTGCCNLSEIHLKTAIMPYNQLTQMMKFDLYRVGNIVGKGENAGYKHFPFYV